MQEAGLGAPLIIAGAAKIADDLMLWIDFRRVKPPEEVCLSSPRNTRGRGRSTCDVSRRNNLSGGQTV